MTTRRKPSPSSSAMASRRRRDGSVELVRRDELKRQKWRHFRALLPRKAQERWDSLEAPLQELGTLKRGTAPLFALHCLVCVEWWRITARLDAVRQRETAHGATERTTRTKERLWTRRAILSKCQLALSDRLGMSPLARKRLRERGIIKG